MVRFSASLDIGKYHLLTTLWYFDTALETSQPLWIGPFLKPKQKEINRTPIIITNRQYLLFFSNICYRFFVFLTKQMPWKQIFSFLDKPEAEPETPMVVVSGQPQYLNTNEEEYRWTPFKRLRMPLGRHRRHVRHIYGSLCARFWWFMLVDIVRLRLLGMMRGFCILLQP